MKYNVYGENLEGEVLIGSFSTEAQRTSFLKRYCRWSGVTWLVWDLSRFFRQDLISRVVYTDEE